MLFRYSVVRYAVLFGLATILSAFPAVPEPEAYADSLSSGSGVFKTDTYVDNNGVEKRSTQAISRELLDTLIYWSEWTAAAYCGPQQGAPGGKVTCGTYKVCERVEKSKTKVYTTWIGVGNASATGFTAVDHTNKKVVISMRGSVSMGNWIADIKYNQMECAKYATKGAMCSTGFLGFWELSRPAAMKGLEQGLQENPDYGIVVTGHSLGGAAAVYAASELRVKYKDVTMYTYGQPRAGNEKLSQWVTAQGKNFRVTHTSDAVPKLPPEDGLTGSLMTGVYRHISPEYWISDGLGNKPENIHVLEGLSNNNGNTGTGQMKFNIIAHIQYFQTNMYYCALPIPVFLGYSEGTKMKRRSIDPPMERRTIDPPIYSEEEIQAMFDAGQI